MWIMERDEGIVSKDYSGILSELCGLGSELKVQKAVRIELYTVKRCVMDRVEGTGCRAYSGI